MHIEDFRNYCLNKPAVSEGFPFDEHTLVFKVGSKMFALAALDTIPLRVNLKCEPSKALELREKYPQITPGYHMNKKHWNSLSFETGLPEPLIKELIDHSYELAVKKMSKTEKKSFNLE